LPLISESDPSEAEPAVLSYTQFRNRECLLAWRQRYSEHAAVDSRDAAAPSNRGRTRPTAAELFARQF
jgi:hypothetical protein